MRRALLYLLCAAGLSAGQEEAVPPDQELFEKARAYQGKKSWRLAKKKYEKLLEDFPDSPLAGEAELRGGDNAFLGAETIFCSGPSERRIDVAVMGDGFTTDASDQNMQERWAHLCVSEVFENEKALNEYRNYFNIHFVRLASLEEGVDPQLSPEERAKIEERNRRRQASRRKKVDFSTALDAKAAGPQGQVFMDPSLVYKWLDVAEKDLPGCSDDRLVIAFARFGRLGMGGGGIANVGRPDKSVTTHEFGHAFSRLLDEYAVNPNPPQGAWGLTIRAANAYASPTEPKPEEVPWAHMLERRRRVKGVGVYEGGATFVKGVWRPARTCAMNAAGNNQFCPVCREQTIKVVYEYVSPIDVAEPPPDQVVTATAGDKTMIVVTPMQPKRHKLAARWYVRMKAVTTPRAAAPEEVGPGEEEEPWPTDGELSQEDLERLAGSDYEEPDGPPRPRYSLRGRRAGGSREEYDRPPEGEESKLGKSLRGKPHRLAFPCGKLAPGRYEVTVEVFDPTPWVVKDEDHLLKERMTWTVEVTPKE